jgi:hypothetical protein
VQSQRFSSCILLTTGRQWVQYSRPLGGTLSSEASQGAGTGYGREEYSPSRQVSFDPERKAVETILVKYEWRATLCSKRVIHCGTTYGHTPNRLWDDNGFAPPPPVRP